MKEPSIRSGIELAAPALPLREELGILSLVAKNTVNAVIITDKENRITWINEGFTKITGYSAMEAIGKKPGNLLQGKRTNARKVHYMAEKMRRGEDFECEILNYKKDGTLFWMRMQAEPIHDEFGKVSQYFGLGTDITDQKKWRNRLTREKVLRQKTISRAILKAQESERAMIGRELHDNVNQLLASVNLYLMHMRNENILRIDILDNCSRYLEDAITEIRNLTKDFVLPAARNLTLYELLEDLCSNLSCTSGMKVILDLEQLDERLINRDCRQNIYRIIQEQVNNTLKYAKATTLKIKLETVEKRFELLMTDDGKGFDIAKSKKGSGLMNIRHRAESFNGKASLVTAEGEGCTLRVSLPLDDFAE